MAPAAKLTRRKNHTSSGRRPSKARPSVTSSAYSRSPPTGSPLAGRVARLPIRFPTRGGGGGAPPPHAGQQFLAPQVVGADAVDRADGAAEDVVPAAELTDLLHRGDVLGLLDDADHRGVPPGVTANAALLGLRDVPARLADPHALGHLDERGGEPPDVLWVAGEQVERDPLRAL